MIKYLCASKTQKYLMILEGDIIRKNMKNSSSVLSKNFETSKTSIGKLNIMYPDTTEESVSMLLEKKNSRENILLKHKS